MHGMTMIFLFVIPMTTGAFGNYLVPLMIGARDMAFPRLNALSFWIFLASGCFIYTGLRHRHGPNAGWFDYVPLALKQYDPGANIDFYALGLILNGASSTAAAINFIVTIFKLRAPGMSLNRMPLFCFAILAVAFALLFALPALTLDCIFLELQRRLGFHFFDVGGGRRPAALAAPVLDLRAPRGLHHRPARVRDRDLDHPRRSRGGEWWRSRSSRSRSCSSCSSASASWRTTCSPPGSRRSRWSSSPPRRCSS